MALILLRFTEVELKFEMLISEEEVKPKDLEKSRWSKDENQRQTQLTCDVRFRNRTQATEVGGEHYHHGTIPAPQKYMRETMGLYLRSFAEKVQPAILRVLMCFHIVLGSTLCDHSYHCNRVESGRYHEAHPSSLHHQSRQWHDTYRNHQQSCR